MVCSEPARDRVRRYSDAEPAERGDGGAAGVKLVGDADVERARLRRGELAQILLLAGLPGALAAAAVVLGLQRVPRDRQGDRSELVRDLPLERRAAVGTGLLQHVMEDAADDGHLLAAVAGQDDGDVGRVGKIVHAGARPGAAGPVVLRREGERVIDAVGITVHAQRGKGMGGEAAHQAAQGRPPAHRSEPPRCPSAPLPRLTECREAYAFGGSVASAGAPGSSAAPPRCWPPGPGRPSVEGRNGRSRAPRSAPARRPSWG